MRKEDRKLAFISGSIIFVAAITFQVMLNDAFKPEDRRAEKDLIAPFAVTVPAGSAGDGLVGLYSEENPEGAVASGLDTPHRSDEAISAWLQRALPEIMNTDANKFDENLKHVATGMNPSALGEYEKFMQDSRILETLQNDNLEMHSFVETNPLLLNKGNVNGRFRWLFEAPVTLTFLPRQSSYKRTEPVNKHIIVQMQIGRMEAGSGVDEMMIETFRVRSNPAYEN